MVRFKLIAVLALAAPLSVLATSSQHVLIPVSKPFGEDLSSLANSTFHQAYHPLADIQQFLFALRQTYPSEVTLERVGYSAEGRDILAAVISRPRPKKNGRGIKKKPRFVLQGAQHAREWIATSTALYFAHALVANASDPWSKSALLDKFDFYIIPMANPDGYQYTWEVDRFWYKNVMPIGRESECKGVDMNRLQRRHVMDIRRDKVLDPPTGLILAFSQADQAPFTRNWGYEWKPSTSPVEGPCAAWYPGLRPFQAPEVNALANYFSKIKRLKAFIDLRSYGQMVSVPFSYSCDVVPRDAEDLLEAALGAAAALNSVHGTEMTTGMLCNTLYKAPGNVLDWIYVQRRVKYAFAVHLRDTGTFGFALPEKWIRPVGQEMGEMVAYLVQFLRDEEKRRKGY